LNVHQVYAAMSTLRSKSNMSRNLIRPVSGYVGRGQTYELTGTGRAAAERIMPVAPDRSAPPRGSDTDRLQVERRETVNHPPHYGGDTTYEVVKVMEAWLTPEEFIGAMKFNSFKYGARHRSKGGLEDLKKKKWYDDKLADFLERHPEVKV
jgi:hypothetical protein